MATDAITYDKSDLRGITRAFKAMDEGKLYQRPKPFQMDWLLMCNPKSLHRLCNGQIKRHHALPKAHG
jgi:hypothetical protein